MLINFFSYPYAKLKLKFYKHIIHIIYIRIFLFRIFKKNFMKVGILMKIS